MQPLTLREYHYEGIEGGRLILLYSQEIAVQPILSYKISAVVQPLTLREYHYEGIEGGRLILFPKDRYSADFEHPRYQLFQLMCTSFF